MELSKLQQQIVESPADKIVVVASAACGKTRTLTERVRFWLQHGVPASEICAITFTNAAADEMQTRLDEDYSGGMFIGTIHALAARCLRFSGYGEKVGKAIDDEQFDLFFSYIKEDPNCVLHYSHVLVDEAQDLSQDEFHFIFDMINPQYFFVVGDYRQNIYENMKGANAKYMLQLLNDPTVKQFDLNENYRNKANILNYAKRTLSKIALNDNSIPMQAGGTIYEGRLNINTLAEWIDQNGTYKDWAILCYSNADVYKIKTLLASKFIPTINFNQKQKTKKELDSLANADKVKVLTVWCAKGLGFPNVVVYGRNWMTTKNKTPSEKREGIRLEYVAYTRAMDSLMILK